MIVLFGSNSSYLSCSNTEMACPYCRTEGVRVHADVPYFHIFYLPIFPLPKIYTGVCPHCKAEFQRDGSSFSEGVKDEFKTPWWTFSGLIIVATIFVLYLFLTSYSDKTDKTYVEKAIEAPQRGMVLEIKTSSFTADDTENYTLLRISHVTHDSVVVIPHQFAVMKRGDIGHLRSADFELLEKVSLSKKELIKMKENGEILRVRK